MCWVSKKLKFKKARKDIRVYKVLNEDMTSVMFNFKYVPGVINTNSKPEFEINYGKAFPLFENSERYYFVCKAFHSYKSIKIARENLIFDYIIQSFIIPKGSIYAINRDGEIVSNQIMMEA